MTTPAVIELPLSTFENMSMEQTWGLDDCLNQARQAWKFFEWYKNYMATDNFPETSFPLLLQITYWNIQTAHQRNVELLWILSIVPRQIPIPDCYWTFSTSSRSRNEFCSFNHVLFIPPFDCFIITLLVSFSQYRANTTGSYSTSTGATIHFRYSQSFHSVLWYHYPYSF